MAPKRVLFAVVRQKLARLGFGSVHELADAWEADVRGAEFSPEELEVFRFVVRQARVTAKKRPIERAGDSSSGSSSSSSSSGETDDVAGAAESRCGEVLRLVEPYKRHEVLEAARGEWLRRPPSAEWVREGRLFGVLGAAPRSTPDLASAVVKWKDFAAAIGLVPDLPPTEDSLLAYSQTLQSSGTFSNAIGKLKSACAILGLPTAVLESAIVGKAKGGLRKRDPAPKEPVFLRADVVEKLAGAARRDGRLAEAALYTFSYAFALRVPSEALEVAVGRGAGARLWLEDDVLVLHIPRRKSTEHPTVLRAKCWCGDTEHALCPVHKLGLWIGGLECGQQPWRLPAATARAQLRRRLVEVGIEDAARYGFREFRSGHSRDLQAAKGCSLVQILKAGQWSSRHFKEYLDNVELAADADAQVQRAVV